MYGRGEVLDLEFRTYGVIPDESAMSSLKCTKGPSGRKPCHKCCNLVLTSQRLRGADLTDLNCTDARQLQPLTDPMLFEAWDRMSVMPRGELKEFQKDIGYTWHPRSFLSMPSLRGRCISPCNHFFDDAMHTYLASNGIACSELIQLEEAAMANNENITTSSLAHLASQGWRCWGGVQSSSQQWFEERCMQSSRTAGYYKGTASVILPIRA